MSSCNPMVVENVMSVYARLSLRLAGFRPLGLAFIIFALANLAIFGLISLHRPLLEGLWLSADRPWGILSAAFVHADFGHLINNLRGFVFAAGIFIIVSAINLGPVRKAWSRAFLWLVFATGFAANGVQYSLLLAGPSFNSWGASGVVYGAFGALLAASLASLPAHLRALAREHRRWAGKRRKLGLFKFDRKSLALLPSLMCLAVVASFLILIFTDPGGFLSAGPGVNVLVHGIGFLFGYLGAIILFRRHDPRGRPAPGKL
ncbi:MAG: rhomboid family intramembrane serine protease [Hadesarchaea archaeon]|nr:rhomboid family intramembrane serine protease [Hadesarchaea archaeon]